MISSTQAQVEIHVGARQHLPHNVDVAWKQAWEKAVVIVFTSILGSACSILTIFDSPLQLAAKKSCLASVITQIQGGEPGICQQQGECVDVARPEQQRSSHRLHHLLAR